MGSIGRRQLQLLQPALSETDIGRFRHSKCGEEIGHLNSCFSELEEACDISPDLTIIPYSAHFQKTASPVLAKIGVHLFVEMPISDTHSGEAELLAFCADRRQVFQVECNLPYPKPLQYVCIEFNSERINKVQTTCCKIS